MYLRGIDFLVYLLLHLHLLLLPLLLHLHYLWVLKYKHIYTVILLVSLIIHSAFYPGGMITKELTLFYLFYPKILLFFLYPLSLHSLLLVCVAGSSRNVDDP
jgi:hypothetical protein